MLIPFPIAFLTGALATDLAYWWTGSPFWPQAAFWLLLAGLATGVLAAVFGLVDFLTVRLPALPAEEVRPPPARGTGPPQAAAQVNRALVVDDNFDVAESMTWMLDGLAREVKMVHSGPAALELVRGWRPDIIVCDIGYETCKQLRQLAGLEKVVIAAVSGYGGEEDKRKSKEAGFDRHLVKPIGRAALEQLVKGGAGG
jgi:CheY-like chemotaxis protein